MQKTLSLIIPTYNMERYLNKCLSSLIIEDEELLKQLEVLIINDGSTDYSYGIAHRYEQQRPDTFRVIDKENGNYGSCINRGLREAKGKYIKVLDADDWFDTAAFCEYLRMLETTDVDAVINNFDRVREDGSVINTSIYEFPVNEVIPFSKMLKGANSILMHAVAYKTENVRSIGYKQTEGISYTDQEWIFLPMTTVKTFVFFDRPLYKYLIGREGQTVNTDVWEKNFWMEIKGEEVMLKEYAEQNNIEPDTESYLLTRLTVRARAIYDAYLLRFKTTANKELFLQFDKMLCSEYPDIYNKVAHSDTCILRNPTIMSIRLFRLGLSRSTILFISAIHNFTLYRLSLIKKVLRL